MRAVARFERCYSRTALLRIAGLGHFMKPWLLSATAILLAAPAVGDEQLDKRFGTDVLIIEASAHACHRFDIYVAISDAQHSRGLMFVRDLPATTGMLFVYDGRNILSMWMKNTFIPLDMVFALADGSISSVVRNTEPQSLRSIVSIEPAAFVLELNAGTTERLVIDENSRIYWEPAHSNDE
jgi:uncharacterized membrane protein (UPF0127 family)